MKAYTLIGIILIVIGIFAFAYQGFTFTTREKVIDLGPIHMTAEKTRTIPLPPIVGWYFPRGRHRVAGRGKEEGLMVNKMF